MKRTEVTDKRRQIGNEYFCHNIFFKKNKVTETGFLARNEDQVRGVVRPTFSFNLESNSIAGFKAVPSLLKAHQITFLLKV